MNEKTLTKSKIRLFLSSFSIVLLIFIDQYTKLLATNNFKGKQNLIIINHVLELTFLKNTGAAFSFMSNNSFFRIIMGIITPIFCAFIIYLMIKIKKNGNYLILYSSFILIISGAIGNYIDRMLKKFVIDFIYFSLINFPVFNVADIYVCVGFFILILSIIFSKDDLFDLKKNF